MVSVVRCPHAGSVLQRNQTLTSEERTMTTIVDGVDAFHELVGKELGHSEWQPITQERVNLFADATDDHQWIHVDPERAKEGPFGVAIAHGYLTLALAPSILSKMVRVDKMKFGVNYGCNKVRFPSPVPVGSELRMGVTVAAVDETDGGVQVTYDLVLEVKDAPKPACVAQVVYRYYR
jgi:acyl dehydratase